MILLGFVLELSGVCSGICSGMSWGLRCFYCVCFCGFFWDSFSDVSFGLSVIFMGFVLELSAVCSGMFFDVLTYFWNVFLICVVDFSLICV